MSSIYSKTTLNKQNQDLCSAFKISNSFVLVINYARKCTPTSWNKWIP